MKRILATTALALMMSTAAFADGHLKPIGSYQTEQKGDIYASEFIGMRVYATENEDYDAWDATTVLPDDSEKEWDDIGEVNDVILGRDGQIKAVVLGIGGFIGIGERDVAVSMDEIKMVNEDDDAGDFFLVVKSNKAMLEQAPEYKRTEMAAVEAENAEETEVVKTEEATTEAETEVKVEEAEPKVEETAEVKTEEATTEAETTVTETEVKVEEVEPKVEETAEVKTEETTTETTTTAPAVVATDAERPRLRMPTIEREGYVAATLEELTADRLQGARVYGSNDEDVGEVDKLILNDSGQITRVVLDVGGFLGIGEHEVAVTMEELSIIRQADGDDFRVYVDATQEELEAQPEYQD